MEPIIREPANHPPRAWVSTPSYTGCIGERHVEPEFLSATDPELAAPTAGEIARQRNTLALIASGNHTWPEVLADKYADGYPGRRYYAGQR